MIGNILLSLPFTKHGGDGFSKKIGDSTVGLTWAVTAGSGRRGKKKEVKESLVACVSSDLSNPSVPG